MIRQDEQGSKPQISRITRMTRIGPRKKTGNDDKLLPRINADRHGSKKWGVHKYSRIAPKINHRIGNRGVGIYRRSVSDISGPWVLKQRVNLEYSKGSLRDIGERLNGVFRLAKDKGVLLRREIQRTEAGWFAYVVIHVMKRQLNGVGVLVYTKETGTPLRYVPDDKQELSPLEMLVFVVMHAMKRMWNGVHVRDCGRLQALHGIACRTQN